MSALKAQFHQPPKRPLDRLCWVVLLASLLLSVCLVAVCRGGITVFAGGMPRATYGSRHTVSILRGSNLDQAVAANLAAAFRAAGDEDDEEDLDEESFDEVDQGLLASGLVPGAPAHVFDADAPEHICLDLPSPLVDVCPLGPAGGPASGLLILCEEEMLAVDLATPGWPLFQLPYLACLHTSSLTTYGLFTQVNNTFLSVSLSPPFFTPYPFFPCFFKLYFLAFPSSLVMLCFLPLCSSLSSI